MYFYFTLRLSEEYALQVEYNNLPICTMPAAKNKKGKLLANERH